MHFWRNYAKIVRKFSTSYLPRLSQELHLVCNFSFTASQYSDKYWSNLLLQCHIFLIGNTQKILDYLRDHLIHALVGLFGTSYHVLVWKHHSMMSSLYVLSFYRYKVQNVNTYPQKYKTCVFTILNPKKKKKKNPNFGKVSFVYKSMEA